MKQLPYIFFYERTYQQNVNATIGLILQNMCASIKSKQVLFSFDRNH